MNKKSTGIISIDKTLHQKLKMLCERHGLKIAFVAERAIEKEIARLEVQSKTVSK